MNINALSEYRGQTFVLKIGGEAVADRLMLDSLLADVWALREAGVRVVIMHGGGPQASELSERLGLERVMVGGRRVTDYQTLQVMKMILAGQVNIDLVAACQARRIDAVGLSGPSGRIIQAVKRPPRAVSGSEGKPVDFGWVGDIVAVERRALDVLLDAGFTPVLSSLGLDEEGHIFNINADVAANSVAVGLGAHKLLLLTGAPGVLEDRNDATTRIPSLTEASARQAIADGRIQGGMIPKVEESIEALRAGVGAIHILSAAQTGALAAEVAEAGSVGTQIVLQ